MSKRGIISSNTELFSSPDLDEVEDGREDAVSLLLDFPLASCCCGLLLSLDLLSSDFDDGVDDDLFLLSSLEEGVRIACSREALVILSRFILISSWCFGSTVETTVCYN